MLRLLTKLPSGLTVKAASTAAVASDQALVVSISPNTPIAVTVSSEVEIKNDSGKRCMDCQEVICMKCWIKYEGGCELCEISVSDDGIEDGMEE